MAHLIKYATQVIGCHYVGAEGCSLKICFFGLKLSGAVGSG